MPRGSITVRGRREDYFREPFRHYPSARYAAALNPKPNPAASSNSPRINGYNLWKLQVIPVTGNPSVKGLCFMAPAECQQGLHHCEKPPRAKATELTCATCCPIAKLRLKNAATQPASTIAPAQKCETACQTPTRYIVEQLPRSHVTNANVPMMVLHMTSSST